MHRYELRLAGIEPALLPKNEIGPPTELRGGSIPESRLREHFVWVRDDRLYLFAVRRASKKLLAALILRVPMQSRGRSQKRAKNIESEKSLMKSIRSRSSAG